MSYSAGTIYKIICTQDSDIVYIGSTFNSLRNRWQQHKDNYKRYLDGKATCLSIYPYFQKYRVENFKIIRIKEYECYRATRVDYKHLQAYEQLWINKTKNSVNKYNTLVIPIVDKERKRERKKVYYENNKNKINEKNRLYNLQNIEKLKERKKQYYLENKDEIKNKTKLYHQENKDEINERRKLHRLQNIEKFKERKKETKFCKNCDKDIIKDNFKRHERSLKHIQNISKYI